MRPSMPVVLDLFCPNGNLREKCTDKHIQQYLVGVILKDWIKQLLKKGKWIRTRAEGAKIPSKGLFLFFIFF